MENNLSSSTGNKVANAIEKRIIKVSKEVLKKSPYTKIERGIITEIYNNKLYSVKIRNVIYKNVPAMTFSNITGINNEVICVIPNNQFSDIFILGALDLR